MRPAFVCLALAIICLPVLAQDEDFTGKVLSLAKRDYAKAVEKAKSGLLDDLKQKADAAQKAGNLNALESIQREIKAYEENGTLPKSISTKSYETQMKAARAKLDDAYAAAVKQYTKEGKLELAKQTRQEAADSGRDDTVEFLNPSNWEGRSDVWTLENGSITCEPRDDFKGNTFFCSKEKYADFELSFKVRLKGEFSNSGVQFRSELSDAKLLRVTGPQFDIRKGSWGNLYGEGIGGVIRSADAKLVDRVLSRTGFNDCTIVAKGTQVTFRLNGEILLDEAVSRSKDNQAMPRTGIIAFQCHTGNPGMRVEFKDIKFKKLK
ncbi:MAG: DUF1080 domain-containing protein [Gemmataceae bacterium]